MLITPGRVSFRIIAQILVEVFLVTGFHVHRYGSTVDAAPDNSVGRLNDPWLIHSHQFSDRMRGHESSNFPDFVIGVAGIHAGPDAWYSKGWLTRGRSWNPSFITASACLSFHLYRTGNFDVDIAVSRRIYLRKLNITTLAIEPELE